MATQVKTHLLIKFDKKVHDYNATDFKDLSEQVEKNLGIKASNQKFLHAGKSFTKKEIDAMPNFEFNGITKDVVLELIPLVVGGN